MYRVDYRNSGKVWDKKKVVVETLVVQKEKKKIKWNVLFIDTVSHYWLGNWINLVSECVKNPCTGRVLNYL